MKKDIIGNFMMGLGVFVQTYFTSWMLIGVEYLPNLAISKRAESFEFDIPTD